MSITWEGVLIALLVLAAVVVLVLLFLLWRKYKVIRSPDTPFPAKFAFWASTAYAVFPVDALPDPILIDDIGVLLAGLGVVTATLRKQRKSGDRPPATS
ncbi:YkvA family protein [Actinokineospora bangkokensis]|uniref:DUF1232 domain-containing protein n=1 Tax=Actinokineospora bangkokensis TaxID=1193682 RepID=A0A1Q9LLK4_9PSEU|nr:hypothetical protein [Actinokineospora bangkokensis]OLR92918.1 hypothetical protein BJP25_18255 [Actinokineospora bangkokensis]